MKVYGKAKKTRLISSRPFKSLQQHATKHIMHYEINTFHSIITYFNEKLHKYFIMTTEEEESKWKSDKFQNFASSTSQKLV